MLKTNKTRYLNIEKKKTLRNLPWPLLTVLPFVSNIWLSSSCSSDFSSANLLLLFFTMDATSDNERRSVVTSRSFSAPSLIYREMFFFFSLNILYWIIKKATDNVFLFSEGDREKAKTKWISIQLPSTPFGFLVGSPLWSPPGDWEVHFPEDCLWIHICDSIHIKLDVLYNHPAIEPDKWIKKQTNQIF